MFFTTLTYQQRRLIHASPEQTLSFLHDPEVMCRLNPLVKSVTLDPKTERFKIVDNITAMGMKTTTTYFVVLTNVKDGMESISDASMGTKVKGKWKVIPQEDGNCVVEEEAELQCPFFLSSFIRGTLASSHEALMSNLAQRIEGTEGNGPSVIRPLPDKGRH